MRVTKLKVDSGPEVDFGFDVDGLVTSVGGLNAAPRGMNGGLLTQLVHGSTTETLSYDGWGAPLTMWMATAPDWGLILTYDPATGRITQKVENWPPGYTGLVQKTYTYTYDSAGRLYRVTGDGPLREYTYDLNGNRQDVPVTPADNQDRVLGQGPVTYGYNLNGAVTTRTVGGVAKTLTYDNAGNLTSVDNVTYVVDAQNRRVGKKVGVTLVREWLYDGQLRVVGEVVIPTPPAALITRAYGYLPERHLPVMMVQLEGGTTTTYRIVGDHLGSLRAVVRSDGTVMQTMQHDEWGKVLTDWTNGFERVPFGFAGGLYDTETGLVRFGARDYDPETGRWLSKDLARFRGGTNFYEYAAGNPVSIIDPDGHGPALFWDCVNFLKNNGIKLEAAIAICVPLLYVPDEPDYASCSERSYMATIGCCRNLCNYRDDEENSCPRSPYRISRSDREKIAQRHCFEKCKALNGVE